MPRKSNTTVESNFTKGLLTYATGMSFPENAVTTTNNFTYRPWGLVERRLGLDFEPGGFTTQLFSEGKAVSYFLWNDVAGDGDSSILVIQTGNILSFYLVVLVDTVVAPLGDIDLSVFQTEDDAVSGWTTEEVQYAAGNGYLFVVGPNIDPIAIQFDPLDNSLTPIGITILVRDFDGIPEEGISVSDRLATLDNTHEYNLVNQGWTATGVGDIPTGAPDTVDTFVTQTGVYPSNADVWFSFKDSTNIFNPSSTVANVIPGNALAPRGHFVLNAFSQARDVASGLSLSPTITSSQNRPTTTAFFAGRVWYAGTKWFTFNQNIYFSQIIDTVGAGIKSLTINNVNYNQFGACFQQNDPTSEVTFGLLPDDGGVVRIPDMGTVYKLWPLQNSLIIFASNGIWVISGSEGVGFTANSFSVNKLSSVRCISSTSFVDVLGYPMWWTHEGVYALTVNTTANQSSGGLEVKSLTDQTIVQFFRTIPGLSKTFARGVYDPLNYIIYWVYNSSVPLSTDDEFTYDSVLMFNTLSQAWYTWSVPIDKVKLRGVFLQPSVNPTVNSYRVKWITSVPIGDGLTATFRFADESNNNYVDWFSFDSAGEPYVSTLSTGYRLHGSADHKFQNRYITLYFENQSPDAANPTQPGTVVSSALVQGVWDYALNNLTNRIGAAEKCIITNDSYQFGIRKIKLRGRGRVFQMNITSDPGFPCNMIGWAITEDINTVP